jgi:hypothetical protein
VAQRLFVFGGWVQDPDKTKQYVGLRVEGFVVEG